MIDPAAIGARILEEMNRQQLSYRDVVEHTGISTGQLFRLFKGEGGYMRTDTLIRLCRYLGLSADWLLDLGTAQSAGEEAPYTAASYTGLPLGTVQTLHSRFAVGGGRLRYLQEYVSMDEDFFEEMERNLEIIAESANAYYRYKLLPPMSKPDFVDYLWSLSPQMFISLNEKDSNEDVLNRMVRTGQGFLEDYLSGCARDFAERYKEGKGRMTRELSVPPEGGGAGPRRLDG